MKLCNFSLRSFDPDDSTKLFELVLAPSSCRSSFLNSRCIYSSCDKYFVLRCIIFVDFRGGGGVGFFSPSDGAGVEAVEVDALFNAAVPGITMGPDGAIDALIGPEREVSVSGQLADDIELISSLRPDDSVDDKVETDKFVDRLLLHIEFDSSGPLAVAVGSFFIFR